MTPIYATWCLSNNIGDALTPWLIEQITGQRPLYLPYDVLYPKYMVAGSILNHAVEYTTVWGAGYANADDTLPSPMVDIRAVRGPVTAHRVAERAGINVTVLGDPALLMPRFYKRRTLAAYDAQGGAVSNKRYKVGLCPHYLHQLEFATWAQGNKDITILNVFDGPERFVERMCECEVVYSSSLHGLVIADAYGIPSQWVEGTLKLGGDRSKFADHLSLIYPDRQVAAWHIQQLRPDAEALKESIVNNSPPAERINELCEKLWQACPFRESDKQERKPLMSPVRFETTPSPNPLLSVLILTIPQRAPKLDKLMERLRPQLPESNNVELIVQEDAAVADGGPCIGKRRNEAIAASTGQYVCFIDDDDMVSEDYLDLILSALENRPDVVGLKGHYCVGDNEPALFIHSTQYDQWFSKGGVFYRCPNHLNPVKRELAVQVPFEELNHGEDQKYSMALRHLLRTEKMIDKVIYFYIK